MGVSVNQLCEPLTVFKSNSLFTITFVDKLWKKQKLE